MELRSAIEVACGWGQSEEGIVEEEVRVAYKGYC